MGNRAITGACAMGIMLGAIGTGLIAIGCGSDAEAEALAKEARARAADSALCDETVAPLQTALENVQADLGVGINFASYGDAVRQIARAYSKMDSEMLADSAADVIEGTSASTDSTCLGAAASFETAYNAYNRANAIWGECIQNIGTVYSDCTSGPVYTRIQSQWSKASSAISNGRTKLERLQALADRAAGVSSGT